MKLRSVCFALMALSLVLILTLTVQAENVRLVVYNSLNFNGQASAGRLPYYETTMRAIDPDVVVMQELTSEAAMDMLLSYVFLPLSNEWTSAPFISGRDTKNVCFFKTSKLTLLSERAIQTELRDCNEYMFRPVEADTTLRLYVFAAHLKASSGADNEAQRGREATTIRGELDQLPAGSSFVVCGDFNLYTNTEAAYTVFLAPTPSPNGQLFDPLNVFVNWHDNTANAIVHTQSTRSADLGDGGATGGMDDRFDFILASAGLMDTVGSHIVSGTYRAFGNDGQRCCNSSIVSPPNQAVPDSVANALYLGSDHLPVTVDIVLRPDAPNSTGEVVTPARYELLNCYPNPFNPTLSIDVLPHSNPSSLQIFDLTGRKIWEKPLAVNGASPQRVDVDFTPFTTGSYFVRLQTPTATDIKRVNYVR